MKFYDFYRNQSIKPKESLQQEAFKTLFRKCPKWVNHVFLRERLLPNSLGSGPGFLPKCELSLNLKLFLKGRQNP